MGKFVKGDIVVLSYPFSDFSGTKRRPALVIADLDGDDVILCQITSQAKTDKYAVKLEAEDFADGKLNVESVIRTNKIFTADSNIILYTACKISREKTDKVINSIIDIIIYGKN
jgi:PemK-like protein.